MLIQPSAPTWLTATSFYDSTLSATTTIIASGTNTGGVQIIGGSISGWRNTLGTPRNAMGVIAIPPMRCQSGVAVDFEATILIGSGGLQPAGAALRFNSQRILMWTPTEDNTDVVAGLLPANEWRVTLAYRLL